MNKKLAVTAVAVASALTVASEVYFNHISPWFTETDMEEIRAAYSFSEWGHQNQIRDDGSAYFEHPKAVSLILFDDWNIKRDWRIIVAALIHDIREDHERFLTERRVQINFQKSTAMTVKFVSKDEHSKTIFMHRLKNCGDWRAILLKLADRTHNMRTLDNCERNKQIRQVKETREHFFELCNIVEKNAPKKYRHALTLARAELKMLCDKYA